MPEAGRSRIESRGKREPDQQEQLTQVVRAVGSLTAEQKAQILAWLTEARELAMDGSTSDEKHAVFGKYKGKINNYLSKAGYDAKKAEQNLRKPAAPAPGVKAK